MSGLPPEVGRAVEAALAARGDAARVVAAPAVGGGSIHDTRRLRLDDGRDLVVKIQAGGPDDLFVREAEGLAALAAPGVLRVPRDPLPGRAGGTVFLLMEAIPEGRPGRGFFADFGRRFAELHRATRGERYGFAHDNYLGGTPQPNAWSASWAELFRDRRLGHQLRLARAAGRTDAATDRLGERLLDRLDRLLDVPGEPACLLHGDLWGGNFMVDEDGRPVLIDPAVYHGHREADLAMTHLFGGFPPDFHAAYEETWPLPPGAAERRDLYQLYHLLNHLNLFGASYLPRCREILRRYAA